MDNNGECSTDSVVDGIIIHSIVLVTAHPTDIDTLITHLQILGVLFI